MKWTIIYNENNIYIYIYILLFLYCEFLYFFSQINYSLLFQIKNNGDVIIFYFVFEN